MYEFKPSEEWIRRAAEAEELLDGHAGPLACSPEIYREMQMSTPNTADVLTYRRLVMPGDLNPANRLFGGEIMKWADEAAAMYAMCQLQTKQMVTLKVSEILFKEPVKQGDLLEFWASTARAGNSSFTVALKVVRKEIEAPDAEHATVLSCEFVFVTVDENGKAIKHRHADNKSN